MGEVSCKTLKKSLPDASPNKLRRVFEVRHLFIVTP